MFLDTPKSPLSSLSTKKQEDSLYVQFFTGRRCTDKRVHFLDSQNFQKFSFLFLWEPNSDDIQLIHWKFWSARHTFAAANPSHVVVHSPEGTNADQLRLAETLVLSHRQAFFFFFPHTVSAINSLECYKKNNRAFGVHLNSERISATYLVYEINRFRI